MKQGLMNATSKEGMRQTTTCSLDTVKHSKDKKTPVDNNSKGERRKLHARNSAFKIKQEIKLNTKQKSNKKTN